MRSEKSGNYFIAISDGGEKAILVNIDFTQRPHPDSLTEFQELVLSAGIEILSLVTTKRRAPDAKYFIGSGKALELQAAVRELGAEVIIFNHELTPAQARNLEKLCDCKVIDRSELILDIFAQRARTHEGKLQVELAQLQHLSTRLVRGWTHLERQKGGIGLRGPGETQLETDRRLLDQRIKKIRYQLTKVIRQRAQNRRSRQKATIPTVAIVGYTNAGKSTLFNALTDESVFVEDQLFATLDPTLRRIDLNGIGKVILADTVGFIRDLPHDLIAAFRATLEETRQADLLLHVVDQDQPDHLDIIEAVQIVLTEIGAHQIPQLLVYNKIDKNTNIKPHIDYNGNNRPQRVWVSAQQQTGFDLLYSAMSASLAEKPVRRQVCLTPLQGKLRAILYENHFILHETIDKQGNYILDIEMPQPDYDKLFA